MLEARFRQAFRRLASTVTVLTYVDADGSPCGMTATAVSSVSATPPTLLACINRANATRDQLVAAGRFGVNILAFGQQEIADYCARPAQQKRLDRAWLAPSAPPPVASPALRNALAHLDCEVSRVEEVETHSVVFGRVTAITVGPTALPVVYFDGRYVSLEGTLASSSEAFWAIWERTADFA